MDSAYSENGCPTIVTKDHALKALRKHAEGTELSFTRQEVWSSLAIWCRCANRAAHLNSSFPMSPFINILGDLKSTTSLQWTSLAAADVPLFTHLIMHTVF